MKKFFLSVFALIFVGLVGIQFKTVNRENPAVAAEAEFSGPPEVEAVLRKACYDCHSNETKWPIYSFVAPMSWVVAEDVEKGRRELNFSEWNDMPLGRQFAKEEQIWDEVESGEMPLRKYQLLHPGARLTEEDKAVLRNWIIGPTKDEGDTDEDGSS